MICFLHVQRNIAPNMYSDAWFRIFAVHTLLPPAPSPPSAPLSSLLCRWQGSQVVFSVHCCCFVASFHFTRHLRMHFNIFVLLSMENWLQILYEMCIAWADLYVAIVAIKMRTMQVLCIEVYFRTADRSTHDN